MPQPHPALQETPQTKDTTIPVKDVPATFRLQETSQTKDATIPIKDATTTSRLQETSQTKDTTIKIKHAPSRPKIKNVQCKISLKHCANNTLGQVQRLNFFFKNQDFFLFFFC